MISPLRLVHATANTQTRSTRLPAFAILVAATFASTTNADERVDFDAQIKPLLSDRCFLCHGPDSENREADLRLDRKADAIRETVSGSASHVIKPGEPEESEIYLRITSDDPDTRMPPPDSNLQLRPEEVQLLKRWIEQGADWREHWSLQAITLPEHPTTESAWTRNEIDAFVLEKMSSNGFTPAKPADRESLVRRLHFDLTGLPPTLSQIDSYLNAADPELAFEKRVDDLLDSTNFGERMASEWLDVARYSDTYGYQVDRDRFVWPWRDWVINAFNENMPYDQFIKQQVAGDLLPGATQNQILATTFNRLHPQKVEGGSVPEEFRIEYVADRTQTFATAFLGLTMECARCHDHKYDPISQQEYYQLSAFFDKVDEAGLYSYFTNSTPTPTMLLHDDKSRAATEKAKQQVAQAASNLETLQTTQRQAFATWLNGPRKLTVQESTTETPPSIANPDVAGNAKAKPRDTDDERTDSAEVEETAPHPVIPGRIWHSSFERDPPGRNKIVKGKVGNAIELTGDDRVELGVGNFTRYQPFSVALWLKTPEVGERAVVFHRSRAWTDAASRGYELLLEDGRLSAALVHFWPGNAIRVKTVDPVTTNRWTHVAITYDGSSQATGLRIYVDGSEAEIEVVRDKLTKQITGGGFDNLMVGERFRDRGFKNGVVDELQIFETELCGLEIQQLVDNASLNRLLEKPIDQLTTQQREQLFEVYLHNVDQVYAKQQTRLRDARKRYCESVDAVAEIMVMSERDGDRQTFRLDRGAYDQPSDPVMAATPASLNPYPADQPRSRLGLANWLVSPDNPLAARVVVNRYWQLIFGEGLVRTPEDFGNQGSPPTHAKLLDYLAHDFMTHGWDVKRLLKKFVMSATYQQAAETTADVRERDPENRLLTRASRFRLPAEMLRDNALLVGGLLNRKMGGPPAKPYELEVSFKPSTPDDGDGVYRRSVYTYWKRTGPAPAMMTLDAAKRDVCRVKRERTSSPLQALVMLNGPQFVEAARGLAQHLVRQHGADQQQIIVDAFRWLTGRRPDETQSQVLTQLLQRQTEYFAANPTQLDKYLAVGRLPVDENVDTVQLAAVTSVVNSLMNYDRSLTK